MNDAELSNLGNWLTAGAPGATSPDGLLNGICRRLVGAGVPLCRVGAFVQTLHPDALGRSFVWRPDADVVIDTISFDFFGIGSVPPEPTHRCLYEWT